MIVDEGRFITCDTDQPCAAKIANHRWGKAKDGADWFFARNGEKAWCPDHIPPLIVEWRKRKAERK